MRHALIAPLFLLAINLSFYGVLLRQAAIDSQNLCFVSDFDLSGSCGYQ
jgi:hypothetical protein